MDKTLQKEHSRRFALLHEKYAAKMESLSEREEDCKRISNNIDQLSDEITYRLRCDMDSLREQIATGALDPKFNSDITEMEAYLHKLMVQAEEEKGRLSAEIKGIRDEMADEDIAYGHAVRSLDEEFDSRKRSGRTLAS